MHRYPTPHTWLHRNHHPSRKCTRIVPLIHECTANRHSSGNCCDILPLTHECTDIIIPQVNAPESYPSYMNALQIVTPQVKAQISYPSHIDASKSWKYIGPAQTQGSLACTTSQAQYTQRTDQTTGVLWEPDSSCWMNTGEVAAN